MEYSAQLTSGQLENTRMKILNTIKILKAEGKISPRRQGNQGFYVIDLDEINSGAARRKRFKRCAQIKKEEIKQETNLDQDLRHFQIGIELFKQGGFQENILYFQYALSLGPSLSQVYQYLGDIYYYPSRIIDAISSYKQYASLTNDPAVLDWLNNFKQQVGK